MVDKGEKERDSEAIGREGEVTMASASSSSVDFVSASTTTFDSIFWD